MHLFIIRTGIIAFILLGLFAALTFADSTPGEREEQRRRQEREAEEYRQRMKVPDVRLQQDRILPEGYDLPAETACFQIDQITLEGDPEFRFDWARRYLSNYAGRCIGREGINIILKRLGMQFIAKGYTTTRVGVPSQDIATRTLKIAVVPGMIRNIRVSDPSLYGTWVNAFPARSGDVLNLRSLEQGLEQMKRLPYQDVSIELLPGEQPGESDVLLKVQRTKPWRLGVGLDNAGSQTTGRSQGALTVSFDNPLGISDLFSGSWNHDISNKDNQRGTNGGYIYYSIPFGWWTLSLSGSQSSYRQTVQGQVEELKYRGSTETGEIGLQYMLYRDQFSKTSLQGKLIRRYSKNWLNDVEIEVQRRNTTAYELSALHRRQLGPAQIDLMYAYRQGVRWLGATGDKDHMSADGPTEQYKLHLYDISVSVPYTLKGINLTWRSQFKGQETGKIMFVSEQLAIGNRYTVRGFDGERVLSAENGFVFRNDLGIAIGSTGQELYGAFDHGQIWGPSSGNMIGKQLTGAGVGLRGRFKGLSYDIFTGWPVAKPQGFRTAQTAVYLQVAFQF